MSLCRVGAGGGIDESLLLLLIFVISAQHVNVPGVLSEACRTSSMCSSDE